MTANDTHNQLFLVYTCVYMKESYSTRKYPSWTERKGYNNVHCQTFPKNTLIVAFSDWHRHSKTFKKFVSGDFQENQLYWMKFQCNNLFSITFPWIGLQLLKVCSLISVILLWVKKNLHCFAAATSGSYLKKVTSPCPHKNPHYTLGGQNTFTYLESKTYDFSSK